jgi:hypothetical protein
MSTREDPRAARARELRRAGLTLAQIKAELGLRSNSQLVRWLQGVPTTRPRTVRPRATDAQREHARRLREEGRSVPEIARIVGVARSTAWSWVRDLPVPEATPARWRNEEYWTRERPRRALLRAQQKLSAARETGRLTNRDLLIAGVVAYWCEGSKDKRYERRERVEFANSDPRLITLWLAFLDSLDVSRSQLSFRVQIHETADEAAALAFWCDVAQAPPSQFTKTTLKRNNPRTNRRNRATGYHGCLTIRVRDSAELYRMIEGWFGGVVNGAKQYGAQTPAPHMEHWRLTRYSRQSAVG